MAVIGFYRVFYGTPQTPENIFNIPVFEMPNEIPVPSASVATILTFSQNTYNSFVNHTKISDILNDYPYPKVVRGSDNKISFGQKTETSVLYATSTGVEQWFSGPEGSEFLILKLSADDGGNYVPIPLRPYGSDWEAVISQEIYYNFSLWPTELELTSDPEPEQGIDRIEVEPSHYALSWGQIRDFRIHAYSGDTEVFDLRFDVGPAPPEASTTQIHYPIADNYSIFRVRLPYFGEPEPAQEFYIPVRYGSVSTQVLIDFYLQNQDQDPYNPPFGGNGGAGVPSGPGGGGGTFPSDPGPSLVDRIPDGQTGNDIAQSGLFTMYLMNQQYMTLMGEILWEDNIGIQAAKEIFGNPINTVISTISYPFNLLNLVQYATQNLYFGQWKTDLEFKALLKSSFQIDWGEISIPFAWGNFLDYAPHTKMELFLPWGPGYVTIDPNDVSPYTTQVGNFNGSTFTAGSIQVITNVELGKGTCVHNVIGNHGRIIGSYSGIVGKQVPITALDTGGKALTTIAAVSTVVGGVVAGSLAAKGAMDTGRLTGTPMKDTMRPFESASYWDTGMISGRASAQNLINTGHNLASRAINSTPITFPRAGTFSDGSSAMTAQTPFLIVSRPVQCVPVQYGHYNGYPSNIHYTDFSYISGYTEISEIHLDNVTATADELQELDTILKGGILL